METSDLSSPDKKAATPPAAGRTTAAATGGEETHSSPDQVKRILSYTFKFFISR